MVDKQNRPKGDNIDHDRYRTSDHRYFRQEQADGTVVYRKDGQYTSQESWRQGFRFAQTEVSIPDPETGEIRDVVVRRDEASALGVIANDPEEGETITVDTVDGDLIEISHQAVADAFQAMESEERDIVRYLE